MRNTQSLSKSVRDSGPSSIPAASVRKVLLAALPLREARPPGALPRHPGEPTACFLCLTLCPPSPTSRTRLCPRGPQALHPRPRSTPVPFLSLHALGALPAPLPACALAKGRGRRDQPSKPRGAGAPPRCSAGGGAHQVNAAGKALATLLTSPPPQASLLAKAVPATPTCRFPTTQPPRNGNPKKSVGPGPAHLLGGPRYLGKVRLQTKAASPVSPAPSFPGRETFLPRSGIGSITPAPLPRSWRPHVQSGAASGSA